MQNSDREDFFSDIPDWQLAVASCLIAEFFRRNTLHKLSRIYKDWVDGGNENNIVINNRGFGRRDRPARGSDHGLDMSDSPFLVVSILAFIWNPEKAILCLLFAFVWVCFCENQLNVNRADEDEVFANSSGGLAYGMAVNYWFGYLRHLDAASVERDRPVQKVILIPSACEFQPPSSWKVSKLVSDVDGESEIDEKFYFPQLDYWRNLRERDFVSDVFNLERTTNRKRYRVVCNFPTILKSTIGKTKGVTKSTREAEMASFVECLHTILEKHGKGQENGRIKIFVYETLTNDPDGVRLQDELVDFLEEEEKKSNADSV